jgi:hypothetical protein
MQRRRLVRGGPDRRIQIDEMKRRVVWIAAAALVVAIAGGVVAVVTTTNSPSTGITTCRASKLLVCIDRSASAKSTTAHIGQVIEVTLNGSGLLWSAVKEVGAQPLLQRGAVTRLGGQVRERFEAVKLGRTALQATATPKCSPGQVCPQFMLLWRAIVTVSA